MALPLARAVHPLISLRPVSISPTTIAFTPTTTTATTTATTTIVFTRHESSARRTTKRLRIQPNPSFLPLPRVPTSGTPLPVAHRIAAAAGTPPEPSLIYNPPASLPNVYTTPSLFLPASDPRKKFAPPPIPAAPEVHSAQDVASASAPLPPPLRTSQSKKYHLTESQISEIRALRAADPIKNNRTALAKRFGASRFFIGMVAEADEAHKKGMWEKQEEVKKGWGHKRVKAREDRERRREGWGGKDGI
ncbi:mitochondrial ribosomal protein subunit L20-domain-containing protein [Kalaharituber pfeilii]|nr:mitochondrial ribosomal protein subunit L20-domain-containing protein [Kalaharituber pfeilii]